MTIKQRSFYCPNSINKVESLLKTGMPNDGTIKHRHGFIKNIGYNIQYIEYLDYNLKNLNLQNLHETVKILTRKSLIVTGMSVIEAILYFILKQKGFHSVSDWLKTGTMRQTNKYKDNGKWHKIELQTFIEVTPAIELTMTLDTMIKKVESKKILGSCSKVYEDLKKLRQLRNRVHIHAVQHDQDTDFLLFEENDVELMKTALHTVLTKSIFRPSTEHLQMIDFLKI